MSSSTSYQDGIPASAFAGLAAPIGEIPATQVSSEADLSGPGLSCPKTCGKSACGGAAGGSATNGTTGSIDTAAILYIWTAAVPASEDLANTIQADDRYKDVISVISADSPVVRNYLLCPSAKVTVTDVPIFVLKAGKTYKTYSVQDAHKVLKIAAEAAAAAAECEDSIELPLPSTLSARNSTRSGYAVGYSRNSSRASSRVGSRPGSQRNWQAQSVSLAV